MDSAPTEGPQVLAARRHTKAVYTVWPSELLERGADGELFFKAWMPIIHPDVECPVIEFDVKDIGSNTLQGCLATDETGRWTLIDIRGRTLVYNYEVMKIDSDELANDIHWLYQHGAACVKLVRWIPAHKKHIGARLFDVPRKKAK
jgi:hypothetical protein